MSRRERISESDLAWHDERRDSIDRIWARCRAAGITKSSEVVREIVNGLDTEMRTLVEVEIEVVS